MRPRRARGIAGWACSLLAGAGAPLAAAPPTAPEIGGFEALVAPYALRAPSLPEAARLFEAGVPVGVIAQLLDPDGDGRPTVAAFGAALELGYAGYRILVTPAPGGPSIVVTGYDARGERLAPPVVAEPEAEPASGAAREPSPAPSWAREAAAPPEVVYVSEPARPASFVFIDQSYGGCTAGGFGYGFAPSVRFRDHEAYRGGGVAASGAPHGGPPGPAPVRSPGPAFTPGAAAGGFIGTTPILYPAGRTVLP